MPQESIEKSFEHKESLESEIEELRVLNERRELLQQHWSELFEKEQDIEFKYPMDVKFDEQRKYKSDRSFLTPEDKEEFDILNEGMKSIREETDELDREILKKRFDLGLKYLAEVNKQEDVIWQETHEHNPDPQNHLDILYSKQWRAKIGNNVAEVNMTGETGSSFFAGMKHVAEEIGDTKVLESLKKWPKERKLNFNEVHLSFSINPRSAKKKDKGLTPALSVTKRFDHYDETMDQVESHLSVGHNTYAFPKIDEKEQEKARNEMINLAKKLGIDSF